MEKDYENLSKSELLIQHKKFHLAERQLRDTIAQGNANEEIHSLLSTILLRKQQFKEAHFQANHGLLLNPENAYCFYAKSLIHSEEGNIEAAISTINEALELHPNHTDYLYTLANLYFDGRQEIKFLHLIDRILGLDPEHIDTRNLKAKHLILINKYQEAKTLVKDTLTIDPLQADSFYLLGTCYLKLVDLKNAKACFLQALSFNPMLEAAENGLKDCIV